MEATTKEPWLEQILARTTRMPVRTARDGEAIQPGTVYIARPDLHLTVAPTRRFQHVNGTRVRNLVRGRKRRTRRSGDRFDLVSGGDLDPEC